MFKSPTTFELIGNFCADIINRKEKAVEMMITDFESHFSVCNEEFEPLNNEHFGVVAISYVDGKIAFVDEDGELTYADTFGAEDFDMVLCIWMEFHEV